jgi:hypothetical protein
MAGMEVIIPVDLLRIVAEPGEVPGGKVARPSLQTLFGTSSIIIKLQCNDAHVRKFIQVFAGLLSSLMLNVCGIILFILILSSIIAHI